MKRLLNELTILTNTSTWYLLSFTNEEWWWSFQLLICSSILALVIMGGLLLFYAYALAWVACCVPFSLKKTIKFKFAEFWGILILALIYANICSFFAHKALFKQSMPVNWPKTTPWTYLPILKVLCQTSTWYLPSFINEK